MARPTKFVQGRFEEFQTYSLRPVCCKDVSQCHSDARKHAPFQILSPNTKNERVGDVLLGDGVNDLLREHVRR